MPITGDLRPEPARAPANRRPRPPTSSRSSGCSGPRLIFRLEEQLEANIDDPGFVYEALKVYLMLGGQAPVDRELVVAWMRRDWADNLYPGAGNANGPQGARGASPRDARPRRRPRRRSIALNGPLVEEAQKTLARMSVAERAYELLKSQARGMAQRDWIVARSRRRPTSPLVFEGAVGEDLESIRVPGFYTYDGFHSAFIDRLASIGEQIESERWVLGAAGEQPAVTAQYSALYQDLLALYTRDFVAAWQTGPAAAEAAPAHRRQAALRRR